MALPNTSFYGIMCIFRITIAEILKDRSFNVSVNTEGANVEDGPDDETFDERRQRRGSVRRKRNTIFKRA